MKIVAGADWRDDIPFDKPVRVADIAPGDPAHCALCGAGSAPLPRDELWALKHRHPQNHAGYVRFYCAEHRPKPAPVAAPPVATRSRPQRERVAAPKRSIPVEEAPKALCPNCFVQVPATGECGICGERVA